jgi:predicted HTH transcriptional regulator
LLECPFCKCVVTNPTKEWNYNRNHYVVKAFTCPQCNINFMAYYHNNKFSHTIPKNPSSKIKIVKYLLAHGETTEEEIANILNLRMNEIKSVLAELQKKGAISIDI